MSGRSLRSMGGELRWMLDPTDPLAPYSRQVAREFLRRDRRAVREQLRLIPTEGHMLKSQALFIRQMVHRYDWIHEFVEVGFNAGHSAYLALATRPDVRVLSFDLGEHRYVDLAKDLIDRRFPGRHQLVKGDSRRTVPEYQRSHPGRRFDAIYIDGGHDYEVAAADIRNCAPLSTPRSLVVMDDLEPHRPYGLGPVRAWVAAIEEGLLRQDLLIEDGFPLVDVTLTELPPPPAVADMSRHNRVIWAVGRYLRHS